MERRIKLRLAPASVLVASALIALAAWPAFVGWRSASGASSAPAAPVKPDWRVRDANVMFLESHAGRVRGDMLTPRMLSSEYLQRYRERGDVGDVARAEHAARRSLAAQPRGNVAGDVALAGALLTLHRFRAAKSAIGDARRWMPRDPALAADEAGLDLELGDVEGARRLVRTFGADPAFDVVAARLDEETGALAAARSRLDRAARRADGIYDTPAERRAWLHARAAELALEDGDAVAAGREAGVALVMFPQHLRALTIAARIAAAGGHPAEAEALAKRAVAIQPNPEVLGLLADAQAARGKPAEAAATRDELLAIARLGDTLHLSDRLVALWEADHGVRVEHAYALARRELALRDDIYAEDALAWTAARSGHWDVARAAIGKALRYGTRDPAIRRHAEVIAAHREK